MQPLALAVILKGSASAWNGPLSGMPHWPITFEGLVGPPRQPGAGNCRHVGAHRGRTAAASVVVSSDVRPEPA
jgi:hypothetical protein